LRAANAGAGSLSAKLHDAVDLFCLGPCREPYHVTHFEGGPGGAVRRGYRDVDRWQSSAPIVERHEVTGVGGDERAGPLLADSVVKVGGR
jgi:hypothetical protein